MPHYPLKRLMLECSHVDDIVKLLRKVPVWANGNYVLCDGEQNILDIETTTVGPKLLKDNKAGFIAHTNHFLCAPYACRENFDKSIPDSFSRLRRLNDLIRSRFGKISPNDIKSFLSDHTDHPTSICRHASTSDLGQGFVRAGQTVAAMIAEPARRRMQVALGNPCQSDFVSYAMD